ncbi:MAG TPA: type II toxin-antitoxin system antitoxin SocA domain-containing protein, partial [Acidimicrobiia bacterium]
MSKHDEPIELADDFEHTLAALLAVPPKGSEEPSSALDVAAALIEMRPGPDQMQLHKLLYLVQAAHLAWYGSPAFRERIEAWRWGPMVRRVAGHYK